MEQNIRGSKSKGYISFSRDDLGCLQIKCRRCSIWSKLIKRTSTPIVDLVEKELLSHPSVRPILLDHWFQDPHAIRVKDDDQLIQELDN